MSETNPNEMDDNELVNSLPSNKKQLPKHKSQDGVEPRTHKTEVEIEDDAQDNDGFDEDDANVDDSGDDYADLLGKNKKQKKEKQPKGKKGPMGIIIAIFVIVIIAILGYLVLGKMKGKDDSSTRKPPTQQAPLLTEAPLASEAPLVSQVPVIPTDLGVESLNGKTLDLNQPQLFTTNKAYLDAGLKDAVKRMFGMMNIKASADSVSLYHYVPTVNMDGSVYVKIEAFSPDGVAVANSKAEEIIEFKSDSVQERSLISPLFVVDDAAKYKITYSIVHGKSLIANQLNPIIIYEVELNVNELHNSTLTVTEVSSAPATVVTTAFDATSMFNKN